MWHRHPSSSRHGTYLNILAHHAPVARVLGHLGTAIRETKHFIADVAGSGTSEEYLSAIADDETEFIETLAGTAFAVCQTQITTVVTHASRLAQSIATVSPTSPLSLKPDKQGLMSVGSPAVPPSDLTRVQVVDTAANYFKHCDQWGSNWDHPDSSSRQTITNMKALGAEPGSTGNLRHVLEALGIPEYDDLQRLAYDVSEWTTSLAQFFEEECIARGLVKPPGNPV